MRLKKFQNILIVETDRIGDLILTLPVFKTIKKNNPEINITALIQDYTKDIFKSFKYADDIITFTNLNQKHEKENLLYTLKTRNFDSALVLHPDYQIAKLLNDAKIPNRFSYGWKWYQYLFSKVFIQHRSKNIKHQLEYNMELLELLNIKERITDVKLHPNREELLFISKLFNTHKLQGKKIIAIHPGSGHSSLNLPIDKYIELIETIKKKFKNIEIIITGSKDDQEIINYIINNTKTSINPMPLNLSLAHLIALISKTSIFISNSTGPMHIASALRVPVIAFFSPVFIHSPLRWGPYWGKKLIVLPDIHCPQKWKCILKNCEYYDCFNTVKFDKAIEFIQKVI